MRAGPVGMQVGPVDTRVELADTADTADMIADKLVEVEVVPVEPVVLVVVQAVRAEQAGIEQDPLNSMAVAGGSFVVVDKTARVEKKAETRIDMLAHFVVHKWRLDLVAEQAHIDLDLEMMVQWSIDLVILVVVLVKQFVAHSFDRKSDRPSNLGMFATLKFHSLRKESREFSVIFNLKYSSILLLRPNK